MWVTRKADLARRGEGMMALGCNKVIDKWIEELVKVCNDKFTTETKPFCHDGGKTS